MSSPSMSSTTTTTTAPSSSLVYKGKIANRSWNNLPQELLRLIITHLLLDVSANGQLPQIWEHREHWLQRMVFNAVRDANALETLMLVSPAWRVALERHLFWQQATAVLDPHDLLLCLQFSPRRLSPYKHFRVNVLERSCIPCRINQPSSTSGLGAAKRTAHTFTLGDVACCKEHRKERFCGICLRDVHSDESITENEDLETWPSVEATCRVCRGEWLWKSCCEATARERDAIGGKCFAPDDWEARQAVDTFVEVGEGNIRDIIALAVEKWWLRKNTKIADMMSLAVATSRLQTRVSAGGSFADGESDIVADEDAEGEDDDDDDPDLMSLTEDAGGVRDLAINDWARMRILDGFWVSPADQWYQRESQRQASPPSYTNSPQLQPAFPLGTEPPLRYIPAKHPCPWTLSEEELNVPHPSDASMQSSPPPSLTMCSSAFEAFKRQLRLLLLPAMTNIVRRIVIECAADGVDPCVKVARMDTEDISNALRDNRTWYNGMDWLRVHQDERRVDAEEDDTALLVQQKKDDADDSSTSSSKSGSQTTSPVLSTSTLQTTPSPPPRSETGSKKSDSGLEQDNDCNNIRSSMTGSSDSSLTVVETRSRKPSHVALKVLPLSLPIAISPVLDSPTPIPSIPFIPESIADLPTFSIESFKTVWREAITPLFQCRCSICERAVLKANVEAGNIILPSTDANSTETEQVWYDNFLQNDEQNGKLQEIVLGVDATPVTDDLDELTVSPQMVTTSDESEDDGEDEQEEEEEQEYESVQDDVWGAEKVVEEVRTNTRLRIPPRIGTKRSCEALEYIEEGSDEETRSNSSGRVGTPPKRARMDDSRFSDSSVANIDSIASPRRMAKRSSEELDDSRPADRRGEGAQKRARTGQTPPPPTSESPSDEGEYILRYASGDGAKTGQGARVEKPVGTINLDDTSLYVLEDERDVDDDVDTL